MNKICVYAICKDEIKYVDQWLDSMSEADYIVVLDTGSTDGTFEKLKADPRVTKVQRGRVNPWRFDVARNRSLKLVPKDANILLCTDFDELFEPGWGDLIRATWTENTVRGHYKYIWSHTPDGKEGHTFIYDKLHTRGYKWFYPVHEVLGREDGIEAMHRFENSSNIIEYGDRIVLHHYPDPAKSRSNYLDLLKLRLQENPTECYSMHLLGREYLANAQYDEALVYFERTLTLESLKEYPLIRHHTLGMMGEVYAMRHDVGNALTCFNLQIQYDPVHREPYVNLAHLHSDTGLYRVALAYLQEALSKTYRHYDWSESSDVWTWKLDAVFSQVYFGLKQYDKALPHALKALKANPTDQELQDNYLKILTKVEMTEAH